MCIECGSHAFHACRDSVGLDVLQKNTEGNQNRYESGVRNPKAGENEGRNLVGKRVRQARLAFETPLTQDNLAGRLAARGLTIDRVGITKIESGQRCVFDFELPAIADALKVDVRWLLGMQNAGGATKDRKGKP